MEKRDPQLNAQEESDISEALEYTSTVLLTKSVVALAFILHAVLGSVCMMPGAMAAEAQADGDEMSMVSMDATSHAHCDQCEKKNEEHTPVGCMGHCLEAAMAGTQLLTGGNSVQAFGALPAVTLATQSAPAGHAFKAHPAAGPPLEVSIATVVLRQ